jgi:hypothetical protein
VRCLLRCCFAFTASIRGLDSNEHEFRVVDFKVCVSYLHIYISSHSSSLALWRGYCSFYLLLLLNLVFSENLHKTRTSEHVLLYLFISRVLKWEVHFIAPIISQMIADDLE